MGCIARAAWYGVGRLAHAMHPIILMKYYSNTIKQRVKAGPNTVGLQLARHAIRLDLSVREIAYLLGAARMTVYNWYAGKPVTNAYTQRVQQLINILKAAPTGDVAWSTACQTFNLQR